MHVKKEGNKNFSNLETDLTEAENTQLTKNTVTALFADAVWR